jgi:hypothetical protein
VPLKGVFVKAKVVDMVTEVVVFQVEFAVVFEFCYFCSFYTSNFFLALRERQCCSH